MTDTVSSGTEVGVAEMVDAILGRVEPDRSGAGVRYRCLR